jgi:hypothetical protein
MAAWQTASKGNRQNDDNTPSEHEHAVPRSRDGCGKPDAAPNEGGPVMARRMEIVFFDDLGFGWLMDAENIERLREKQTIQEILIQRSLAELLRKTNPM